MNPKKSALFVIDVQQELFNKSSPIYNAETLFRNINALIDRAHQAGVPVFYVQHSNKKDLVYGSEGWQLHPQLHPVEGDCFVHKLHGDAFEETGLDETLKSRSIDNLVVTGLVTHGCVRATCIGAKKLGYKVVLVEDGHSNYSKKAAQLIKEWNQKLSTGIVELAYTSEIKFE
jgi:nicotinamidase-related amidase